MKAGAGVCGRGMAECGQCVAGLAVPELVVEERVIWGRFCVRGQARSRLMHRRKERERARAGCAVVQVEWERGREGWQESEGENE